jgi:hypothetical protein
MANQGFVQNLNLLEVTDGAKVLQNLAGGGIDADLRIFAGLSAERSQLYWDRFLNSASIEQSGASLENATQFKWSTDYTYTDDDYVRITPINYINDFAVTYIGFDVDGLLSNNVGGQDIVFDRGEQYIQGSYNALLQGGSGSNARATININAIGEVESVEITNNGTGYQKDDILTVSGIDLPGGLGFAIRIVGNPWKVVLVGNYAWNVDSVLETSNLQLLIENTTLALDGTYTASNTWGLPNDATLPAYDVNRRIYAQNKITSNSELYDVTGDGLITQYDVELLNEYYNNNRDESWFIDYVNNNPIPTGSIRQNGKSIYLYLTGLDPSVFDVDGTGEFSFDYSLLTTYVTNGGSLYTKKTANTLIQSTDVTSASTEHAISVSARVGKNPVYTFPAKPEQESFRPYFILYSDGDNYFDNFSRYGTRQICQTTLANYNSVQLGVLQTYNGVKYRIINKFTQFVNNQIEYYLIIVTSGTGFTIDQTFLNITPKSNIPVFNAGSEYGVFDSNGSNAFFLRTNPRSSVESIKEIILFSDDVALGSGETLSYSSVPTTTIIPDLLIERDDSLVLSNVQNLESPFIVDNGNGAFSGTAGGFSYNIRGYATELENVAANVEESVYLRTTKYRIDRNLYYEKEITIDGFVTSYDPDGLNVTQTDLLLDNSPGIYISNSLSQITNTLASDFAQKTRSYSSDYNPWTAKPDLARLETQSLNVTINDLVFTTEIELDLGNYQGTSRFKGGNTALGENMKQNFEDVFANGESFKLRIEINGEEYYLIMRKS